MTMEAIYLDHHATTPCDPRVLEAMLPYFTEHFGNPSGAVHAHGRRAENAVETARERVARLLGADASEIAFTGGATESNNLAILGAVRAYGGSRRRLVTSSLEHKAVLEPFRHLAGEGFKVVYLPALSDGTIDLEEARAHIDAQTLLVSVQLANNELGTIQPLRAIAEIAHTHGAILHSDASQAVGKIEINADQLGIDLLSLSGHKFYGPKGIGALYVRGGISTKRIAPLMFGGGQERGVRNGTLNVPAIVGLGEACRLALEQLSSDAARISRLRDRLEWGLLEAVEGLLVNGRKAPRLPGSSSLCFRGLDADALLMHVPQLSLSTGSACTSGAVEPSHVLTAIGLSREDANATIRVGLGRFTSAEEVEQAIRQLREAASELRSISTSPIRVA
jgi:cysteine desulfurase